MPQPDVERWQRTYSHLLDIERHRTEQVQNQQQRISTVLTVNGFLLGFLGSVGFSDAILVDTFASTTFIFALLALTFALAGLRLSGPVSRLPSCLNLRRR